MRWYLYYGQSWEDWTTDVNVVQSHHNWFILALEGWLNGN